MAKRKIPAAALELALNDPDHIEPDEIDDSLEHRLRAIEDLGGRVLRVIVNTRVAPERVVTVYYERAK